jgi:hypothetical protein
MCGLWIFEDSILLRIENSQHSPGAATLLWSVHWSLVIFNVCLAISYAVLISQ